jgi:hypothetical protein
MSKKVSIGDTTIIPSSPYDAAADTSADDLLPAVNDTLDDDSLPWEESGEDEPGG